MAKPKASPRFKSPQAIFPVPPFISQAEVVNVLRLRSQLASLRFELDNEQQELLKRLSSEARVEPGPYACAEHNAALAIWENDGYQGVQWRMDKKMGVL